LARTSDVTIRTVIDPTWMNAHLDDYMSQTDTTDQNLASDLEVAAGKEVRVDTISETTGAAGVTIDSMQIKDSIPYCDTIAEKTGAAGVTVDGVKHKDGDVELATGVVERTMTPLTLGVGDTTFAVTGEFMEITGDGGANTIATITGGQTGQTLVLLFVDANVTITDTDAHTANTVDLSAAFTSADDTTLTLKFDGTSWYELSRSVN
jgi:hypothetical protein